MNIQQDDQVSDVNSTPVQAVSVGNALREARERLGLSVTDVANRIKFAPRQIEWLEEDDYVRLPEAAFVRGFVRSYARLVELDPAHLLASLPSSHVQAASTHEVKSVEIPMPTALTARRHNIIWLAAALVIALSLAIFERLHDRTPAQGTPVAKMTVEPIELPSGTIDSASAPLPEQSVQPVETAQEAATRAASIKAPAPAPVVQESVLMQPVPATHAVVTPPAVREAPVPAVPQPAPQPAARATPQPPAQHAAQASQAAAPVKKSHSTTLLMPWQPIPQLTEPKEQASAAHTGQAPASAEQPVNADASGAEHALRIELDEDAWIEVKDASGKMLISKMFAAGSLVRVAGRAPMQVVIGNARAARLFDNGKKVNLARYTTAEVAKIKLK